MLLLLAACFLVPEPCEALAPRPATCTDDPALCAATPETTGPADALAHITFLSEGYMAPGWMDLVVEPWLSELAADPESLVGQLGGELRISLVHVESGSAATTNADRSDTAFGACLTEEGKWRARDDAALLASPTGSDVAVVVINSADGRANADLGTGAWDDQAVVRIDAGADAATLDHELAHALVGLGDEYTEDLGDYDTPTPDVGIALPVFPNLAFDADGDRWAELIDGAVEGGDGHATGIWHPTDSCRMLDDDDAYCAVCSAHIDAWIAARRGASAAAPECSLTWTGNHATLYGWDADAPLRLRLHAVEPSGNGGGVTGVQGGSFGTVEWDVAEGETLDEASCTDGTGERVDAE